MRSHSRLDRVRGSRRRVASRGFGLKEFVVLKPFNLFALALAGIAASVAPGIAAVTRGADPLPLTRVAGGSVLDPVVAGDLVYIPSGRIVTTWDYSNPAAPQRIAATDTAPTNGVIRGLTRWGAYLYASWQAGDDSGGVAVYSLRDPRAPELVNQFSDYAPPSFKSLWTLAAANGYLYLFDNENGIYYGDLAPDPLHPTFTRLVRTPVPYERSVVAGDRIFASGTTNSSMPLHACVVLDVTAPSVGRSEWATVTGAARSLMSWMSMPAKPRL